MKQRRRVDRDSCAIRDSRAIKPDERLVAGQADYSVGPCTALLGGAFCPAVSASTMPGTGLPFLA